MRAAFEMDQQNKLLEEAELTSERAFFVLWFLGFGLFFWVFFITRDFGEEEKESHEQHVCP